MAENFENLIMDFSKVEIKSKQDGLIHAFGILGVQLPTRLLNLFSADLLQSILNTSVKKDHMPEFNESLYDYAGGLLENAAAECGFYTAGGIINSQEFQSIVNSTNPEDILYGLFAIAVSWGWGDFKIAELIPYEKLVLRAYDYYEADVVKIYKPKKYFAYMITGVCRAFMDIVYNKPSYSLGGFKCKQTRGIDFGNEYGEFITTKISGE